MKIRNLLLIALIVLTQGACSLLFVQGPPKVDPSSLPPAVVVNCTEDMTIPVLDLMAGVGQVALAAWIWSLAEGNGGVQVQAVGVGLQGVSSGMFGVSGQQKVRACREFLAARRAIRR